MGGYRSKYLIRNSKKPWSNLEITHKKCRQPDTTRTWSNHVVGRTRANTFLPETRPDGWSGLKKTSSHSGGKYGKEEDDKKKKHGDDETEGGGIGDYLKLAQGFMNKKDGGEWGCHGWFLEACRRVSWGSAAAVWLIFCHVMVREGLACVRSVPCPI